MAHKTVRKKIGHQCFYAHKIQTLGARLFCKGVNFNRHFEKQFFEPMGYTVVEL